MNYIGEICRYLVVQPVGDFDTRHKIRLAVGNGLKSSVWTTFQSRFKIKNIVEFYASTEGTGGMANTENRPGAVGFNSLFLGLVTKSFAVSILICEKYALKIFFQKC